MEKTLYSELKNNIQQSIDIFIEKISENFNIPQEKLYILYMTNKTYNDKNISIKNDWIILKSKNGHAIIKIHKHDGKIIIL